MQFPYAFFFLGIYAGLKLQVIKYICLALVTLSLSSLKLYISIPFMHEAYLFEMFWMP